MASAAVIAGAGAQTPVGLTLPTTAAAVRAALSAYRPSPILRRVRGAEPVLSALVSTLPAATPAPLRMLALARAAAAEAVAPWQAALRLRALKEPALPVLMAIPGERPGLDAAQVLRLGQQVLESLPLPVDPDACAIAPGGHDAGLFCLGHALELLAQGQVPACLVGGIESYHDRQVYTWLESINRLKGDDQPNGFVPGEGAGFLLVCTEELAGKLELPILARVVAVNMAEEPAPWYSELPTRGEGLTEVLWGLFDKHKPEDRPAEVTWCDLNGESWRADEWALAWLRTGRYHGHPLVVKHPASSWGDVGAASGPLLVILAAFEMARSPRTPPTALVWAAPLIGTSRTACLLRRA